MLAAQIDHLTKKYGRITAIDDLSIGIAANQIFGFLGPDGAGKTSLFRILCGILSATAGRVVVAGTDVRQSPEKIKPELGYMAQKFALYADLTVRENLDFFAALFQTPAPGLADRKKELLQFASLWQFQDRLAGKLSGGMKQKLALCCTLIHTPRILILDEPTTGVDPVSRQEFWEMLLPLPAGGTTVIVSTAYMDEAAKCDRIAIMNRGKILQVGTPAELKAPLREKIFAVHSEQLLEIQEALTPWVKDAQLLGDRLHVRLPEELMAGAVNATGAAEGREWLQKKLSELGYTVTLDMVEPSLEDVFVELLAK